MYRQSISMLSVVLACATSFAAAQEDDPIAVARERAAQLAEIRDIMGDPDPFLRLAYLEAIAKSGDATSTQLAARIALASDDADLRSLAFRVLMPSIQTLTFNLALPEAIEADRVQNKEAERDSEKINLAEKWGAAWSMWANHNGAVTLSFEDFDFERGDFRLADMSYSEPPIRERWFGKGQISGLSMNFALPISQYGTTNGNHFKCGGEAMLQKDGRIEGELSCGASSSYKIVATLLGS